MSPSCSGTCLENELSEARVRWDVRGADRPSACPEILGSVDARAIVARQGAPLTVAMLADLLMMTVSSTPKPPALTPTAAEAFASALRINAKTRW